MEDEIGDRDEDGLNNTEVRRDLPWGITVDDNFIFRCPEAESLDHSCDCRPTEYSKSTYHSIPFGLFYCSRAVYEEVSTIFYAQNRFRVAFTGPGSFGALRKLRPESLLKLRFLRVVLHAMMKDEKDCNCPQRDEDRVIPLRRSPPRRYRNLMNEWKMACEVLGSGVRTSQLEMCLICDTDDAEVVNDVFAPLMPLPALAGFSIRLSLPWNNTQGRSESKNCAVLYKMAKNISSYVTGRSGRKRQAVFRFDLLPRELWRLILEYTELVAPFHVAWSPGRGYSSIYSYHGRSPKGCQVCDSLCMACCAPPNKYGGAWATDCSCWRYPAGIFAVNREFNEEAKRIFWSMNKFVIFQPGADWSANRRRSKSVDELIISDVAPPGAIKYLRFIQFSCPGRSIPPLRNWVKSIEALGRLADLSKLTITVDMCGEYDPVVMPEQIREEEYWKEYNRLIEPLRSLRELKAFYLHAAWPIYGPNRQAVRLEWAKRVEREVMGDEYSSNEETKLEILGRLLDDSPSDYDD